MRDRGIFAPFVPCVEARKSRRRCDHGHHYGAERHRLRPRVVHNTPVYASNMVDHVLIVGAGQAATHAAETLRRKGHAGRITLLGDESELPYQRPPLSKKYLAGDLERDRLLDRKSTRLNSSHSSVSRMPSSA